MTEDNKKEPTLLDVAKSVLWAFLGVQKSKNYERDFKHGKPAQYIIIGLIGVAIFIFILVMVVQFVLSLAGV
ncbi:MAG: DUF2970 domain-containing protein [Gammaproteobacteria bacterium]|nr:DUF2970 domain-containing protein [Gammaproteobacteria bacterium]MCW8987616.1 DUF2970 domain-containing protein [Gammaproteobacteria bacterium]